MRSILIGLALVGVASCGAIGAPARGPNFVFVLADDLGYGDLSCFGQRRFETPELDRLAEAGTRLTQHYAGSTVCAPSRCALMTGLHTGHASVRGNRSFEPEGQTPMAEGGETLPQLLTRAGYACGAFGKWGLGYPGSGSEPRDRGFADFFGYNCQAIAHRYFGVERLWEDGHQVEVDPRAYTHDLIFERALRFIRANRDRPFFCFLPVTIPHAALEAPAEAVAPFRERFPQFEGVIGRYAGAEVRNPAAAFAAMVTRLDRDCGRLVALLEELGLADETIVIFTSDNGPHVEGGHRPDFFDSNGPFRGHKRDLYEGGIRVPTIVWGPDRVAAGVSNDVVSAGWDWLPTLCDWAGVSSPEPIDGVSIRPTLTGEDQPKPNRVLYWEFHELGGRQAIRRGPWKAVRYDVATDPGRTPELYHLPTDPGEAEDLAERRPEVLAELVPLLTTSRTPSPEFRFGRRRAASVE